MTERGQAISEVIQWHLKQARICKDMSEDVRLGKDIQEKAKLNEIHHNASAAGITNLFYGRKNLK